MSDVRGVQSIQSGHIFQKSHFFINPYMRCISRIFATFVDASLKRSAYKSNLETTHPQATINVETKTLAMTTMTAVFGCVFLPERNQRNLQVPTNTIAHVYVHIWTYKGIFDANAPRKCFTVFCITQPKLTDPHPLPLSQYSLPNYRLLLSVLYSVRIIYGKVYNTHLSRLCTNAQAHTTN